MKTKEPHNRKNGLTDDEIIQAVNSFNASEKHCVVEDNGVRYAYDPKTDSTVKLVRGRNNQWQVEGETQ